MTSFFNPAQVRLRKGEAASAIEAIRKSPYSPVEKQLRLAALNSKLDLALGRISLEEFNLSVQEPHRAVIRLEQQSRAYDAGNLHL